MHTVIKGTKTIAEYKQVQEDMQEKARAYFDAHRQLVRNGHMVFRLKSGAKPELYV